jgi:hypothetical protein
MPLKKHQVQLLISLGDICLFSMEDCAPLIFLGNWALVVPYLCFRFHIFNKLVLDKCVFQVEGSHVTHPHIP